MKKFLVLIIILFFSCKKEDPIPVTIYPFPYLPVYPGSYWKYLNQNGDTVLQTTSTEYVLHRYKYKNDYEDNNMTSPVYVPFWNGIPVYGYSSPIKLDPLTYYTQVSYLSTKIGQEYKYYTRFGMISRLVANIDTSLVLFATTYNNVIVVNEYHLNPPYEHPPVLVGKNYYAKDIGLVMEEDLYDTIKIISYYINH